MDGTQEGVNTEQSAAAPGVVEAATTGVNQEIAPDTSVQTSDAGVQQTDAPAQGKEQVLADGTLTDKPVPFDRFKEVNDRATAAEARSAELEQYIQIQKANPPQQTQPEQQGITLQVMKELGLNPEDMLTGEEQAKVNDAVLQRVQIANQSQFQSQSFIASKPDFAKVVGVEDLATGQFKVAPPLQRIIDDNPGIAQDLRNAGSGANRLAYALASKDTQYLKEVAEANKPAVQQASEQASQVIAEANKQSSISAVSGVGSLDRAAAIRAMSDDEFEAHKQQIMNQVV